MLYTKKKKQDPELFLCVHETIRTPVRTKMFEPPIWNPTKLQQESADFFFRPVVERGLCDFLLCACRPHLLQTRSRDRISVWNVKIFIMTHFILYSTFKVFFFFFSFLSFSETGVWKSSCRGQNKICDFSVTRLISSSISLFYEEMFVWIDVKLQGHSAAG